MTLLKWFRNRKLARLSKTLRARAEAARFYKPDAYVFSTVQLASLLGRDSSRLHDVLEFMRGKGWAGRSGEGGWWIL